MKNKITIVTSHFSLMLKCILSIYLSFALITTHAQPVFPLHISENRRYFVDKTNAPFLYNGDTGWQLFLKLTTEEAREYLLRRKQQGFNTIQTMIAFTPEDINRYGEKPFHNNNDFSKPNEAYFDHIVEVIKIADSLHILIVMAQPWLDCCRAGWGLSTDKPLKKKWAEKNI